MWSQENLGRNGLMTRGTPHFGRTNTGYLAEKQSPNVNLKYDCEDRMENEGEHKTDILVRSRLRASVAPGSLHAASLP